MTVVLHAQNAASGRVTGRSYKVAPVRRRGRLSLLILAGRSDMIVFEPGPMLVIEPGAIMGRRDARLLDAHVTDATPSELAALRADGFTMPAAVRS